MKQHKFLLFLIIVIFCPDAHSISSTKKAKQIDQAFLMSQLFIIGYVEEFTSGMAKLLGDRPYSAAVVSCFREAVKPGFESRYIESIKSALSQDELDEGYKYSSGEMYDSLSDYVLNNRLELTEEFKKLQPEKKYDQFILEKAADATPLTENQRIQLANLINWKSKVDHKFEDPMAQDSLSDSAINALQTILGCKKNFN